MKERFKKAAVFGTGVLLAFFFWNILLGGEEKEDPRKKENEISKEHEEEHEEKILLFAGDIMLNRGVKRIIEKHGEDYTFPFLKIEKTLKEADLLFGNLESMISDKGKDTGSVYPFRAEPKAIEGLIFAGFDVVSLANNHAFDYGRESFKDAMERLEEEEIKYTGGGFNKKKAHSPAVITLEDGTRVGFLGYTEFLYPYAMAKEERAGITNFSQEKMKDDIEKGKKDTDFLVVTFHYGEEYQKKQNAHQELLSKKAIDYGADIVIGHHPHVTQPVEKYEGKYIAYSLGNFIFDQYFSEETMRGFLLEIKLEDGKVKEASKIHYKLNEYYQPEKTKREKINTE